MQIPLREWEWGCGVSAPQLLQMVSGRSQLLVGHCREGLGPSVGFGCRLCLSCLLHGPSSGQHPAKPLVASEQGKRTDRESKVDGSQSSVALR